MICFRRWTGLAALIATALAFHISVYADGIVVDKVYDPYVQPLETEVEFRSLLQRDNALGDAENHRLGLGHALTDRLWAEAYVIGTSPPGGTLSLDGFEAELKWQLTEQGEFAYDWGLLFELEREFDSNVWEFESSVIAVKEWNKWVGTANFKLIYEWGNPIQDEFETALHVQARYRYQEKFEPALELHLGQDTVAMGPALTGLWRFGGGKKLRWQVGVYPGLTSESPNLSGLALLEYEF